MEKLTNEDVKKSLEAISTALSVLAIYVDQEGKASSEEQDALKLTIFAYKNYVKLFSARLIKEKG